MISQKFLNLVDNSAFAQSMLELYQKHHLIYWLIIFSFVNVAFLMYKYCLKSGYQIEKLGYFAVYVVITLIFLYIATLVFHNWYYSKYSFINAALKLAFLGVTVVYFIYLFKLYFLGLSGGMMKSFEVEYTLVLAYLAVVVFIATFLISAIIFLILDKFIQS